MNCKGVGPAFWMAVILIPFLAFGIFHILPSDNDADDLSATISFESQYLRIEQVRQNQPEEPHAPGALKIPIFIYHSVRAHIPNESQLQDAYDITPELLERQLAYLQINGYTAITLDQLATDLETGTTSPIAKPVVLTFDDGWQNQYKNAFPLLKKYHMTATFYVFTNPIGKKPHFLTWDELREMDKAGMTIGDHTLSHPYFRTLPPEEIKIEATESKKILESELGKPVLHFASPFGSTNPQIQQTLKDAGYKTARTTYKGIYHARTDLLKLRGILVSDNFEDFVRALNPEP